MSISNRLCLDFINAAPATSYAELVAWGAAAGAFDPGEAEYARTKWADTPDGVAALGIALAFRLQLKAIADRLLARRPDVSPDGVARINELLRSRLGYLEITPGHDGWEKRWKVPLRRAEDVLWAVARSAADLLSEDDPALLKRCENPKCGWLFYDTTKNHRRRWCSMETCGSRAKAAAYYERRRRELGGAVTGETNEE